MTIHCHRVNSQQTGKQFRLFHGNNVEARAAKKLVNFYTKKAIMSLLLSGLSFLFKPTKIESAFPAVKTLNIKRNYNKEK